MTGLTVSHPETRNLSGRVKSGVDWYEWKVVSLRDRNCFRNRFRKLLARASNRYVIEFEFSI